MISRRLRARSTQFARFRRVASVGLMLMLHFRVFLCASRKPPNRHTAKTLRRGLVIIPCHSNMMTGGLYYVLLLIIAITRVAQALAPKTTPVALHSGLCVEDNFSLRSILDRASGDAQRFGMTDSLPMGYSIFNGSSALRSLLADDDDGGDLDVFRPSSFGVYGLRNPPAFYLVAAALLLSRGNLEASHEVILGVTPHNLDEAEYAATHRGETDWAEKHPLTDTADRIHSIIHRLEGPALGEGNHTGYDNAKYWILGGPKELACPAHHPIRNELRRIALEHAPCCCGFGKNGRGAIVAGEGDDGRGSNHRIIVGGGGEETTREVGVPPGEWEDVAFIDACRLRTEGVLSEEECREIAMLQEAELLLVIRHELISAGFGGDCD